MFFGWIVLSTQELGIPPYNSEIMKVPSLYEQHLRTGLSGIIESYNLMVYA